MEHQHKSQRTDGFRGGIQDGTVAIDALAKSLDQAPRAYVDQHDFGQYWVYGYEGDALKEKLGSKSKTPIAGMFPDGGIYLDAAGNAEVVFESKKQGNGGNAVERWAKNALCAMRLGVKRYVTFCIGEGFEDGQCAERQLAASVTALVPEKDGLWGDDDTQFVCYRFTTQEEALAAVPKLIEDNLHRFWSEASRFGI